MSFLKYFSKEATPLVRLDSPFPKSGLMKGDHYVKAVKARTRSDQLYNAYMKRCRNSLKRKD